MSESAPTIAPLGKDITHPWQRRGRRPSVNLEQIDREAAEDDLLPPDHLPALGKHHAKAISHLSESEIQDFNDLHDELTNLYETAVLAFKTAQQRVDPLPATTAQQPTPIEANEAEPRNDTEPPEVRTDDQPVDSADEARPEATRQEDDRTAGEGDRDATEAQSVLTAQPEQPDPDQEEAEQQELDDDPELDPDQEAATQAAFLAAMQADQENLTD